MTTTIMPNMFVKFTVKLAKYCMVQFTQLNAKLLELYDVIYDMILYDMTYDMMYPVFP